MKESGMRARLKSLHSPDVANLQDWSPEDEAVFGFALQAMIGPEDGDGAEAFDILVCSPGWLSNEMTDTGVRSGEHTLFLTRYDYHLLHRYIERRAGACEAATWPELTRQLGRMGHWEFDAYQPRPPQT
jgi:hypothetical protein